MTSMFDTVDTSARNKLSLLLKRYLQEGSSQELIEQAYHYQMYFGGNTHLSDEVSAVGGKVVEIIEQEASDEKVKKLIDTLKQ